MASSKKSLENLEGMVNDILGKEELKELDKYLNEYSYANALMEFLNTFYFRMPGGWYVSLKEYCPDYERLFEDIKNALLESGLSMEECSMLENLGPVEQKKYILLQKNKLAPIMFKAYVRLREKYNMHELRDRF